LGPELKEEAMPTRESEQTKTSLTQTGAETEAERLTAGSDELMKQWIELAKSSEQTALATVRKFVETVEHAMPLDVVDLSRRREVIDAALEMAQRLIHTQQDFVRSAVRSMVLVNVDVDVDVDVDVASRQSTS
jgi:hypothetical protein